MSNYAVLGNPISQSKSPFIHTSFAKQTSQEMTYTAICLEPNEFESFVREFFAGGGKGLNVTVPFKEEAFALAASCSPRAELAKAVNTLFVDDQGEICGDNTDGVGITTDIKQNNGVAIAGSRVLILGAGGAVRGVLAALAFEQVDSVVVANRTVSKAEQLVAEFESLLPISALSLEALEDFTDEKFDLIINGTSASLQGEQLKLSSELMAQACCCYDLMYAPKDTPFVAWGKKSGAKISIDGLGMLVEQAAEAFALWRGVRPDTATVIKEMRS